MVGCVGLCVTTLLLAYDIRTFSRRGPRMSFIPPFSFPLALDNGFKRVHTGRFRNKLSFGAKNVVKGPIQTLTSKFVSHVHIARKSNCMLSIYCSGNCSAVGHRLDKFAKTVTGQMRSLRCGRRGCRIRVIPRPNRCPIGTKRRVT